MNVSNVLDNLVSISQFNQGQASKFFTRAKNGESFVVIKNNVPVSVIVSPEEYKLLRDVVSACQKASVQADGDLLSKLSPLLEQINALEDKELLR